MRKYLISLIFATFAAHAQVPDLPPPPPPPVAAPGAPLGMYGLPADGLRTYGPGLPVAELVKLVLGEQLRKPYVLSPAAASANALVSADLAGLRAKATLPVLERVLRTAGYTLTYADGVYFVDKATASAPPAGELLVYMPKHRSIGSLQQYFNMFPHISFTTQAGMATPAPATATGTLDTQKASFSSTDKNPGVLIARGAPEHLAELSALLAKLDVPVPEVIIRAYLIEVRDSSGADSAVQATLSFINSSLSVGGQAGGASPATPLLSVSVPNLSVAMQHITTSSRFRLVSSPVLRASHGATASMQVGTDTPTLGAVVTQQGSTTQSVTYQQSGVILNITPEIYEDSIKLDVSQELSSFAKTETGLADTPTKLRRSFNSTVSAKSGDVVLLGGLSDGSATQARSSNFWLFGSRGSSEARSEIVVLLHVERVAQ